MARSSVTRSPRTKFGGMPARSIARLMALPPPCTSTTLMPTVRMNATSLIRRNRFSGDSMTLPPTLTTTVLPRKSWM